MQTNYSYPLEPDWTPAEVVQVMKLYNLVEQAYEFGAKVADLQAAYRDFKVVVQSKMQEKKLIRPFQKRQAIQYIGVCRLQRGVVEPKSK